MTLVEFLTARLDEDEASDEVHEMYCESVQPVPFPCDCGWRARWPREIEAKRAIVAGAGLTMYRDLCLRALAAVYADHPDYDEAWRP
jgi:hypothetical protein